MLNNFRTIKRTWDRADTKFRDEIVLSSSDENGRKIEIQVIDNGQVVDLTGVSLNLYWETPDKHYNGLDSFTAKDIKKGVFELYPTTGMLSHVGKLKAWLYLVTMQGETITSVEIPITIERGINTNAVESQDSFSALTEGLARLVAIETDELLRQQQEVAREQAEQAREVAYQQAESNRDNLYESAESNRDDLYDIAESVRTSQHLPRISALEDKTPGTHEWGIESGSNEFGGWVTLPNGYTTVTLVVDFTNETTAYATYTMPVELNYPITTSVSPYSPENLQTKDEDVLEGLHATSNGIYAYLRRYKNPTNKTVKVVIQLEGYKKG